MGAMTVIEEVERTYGQNTADAFLASLYVMKADRAVERDDLKEIDLDARREVISWVCVRMLKEGLKEDDVTDMVNYWGYQHRIEDDTEGYQHYWWDTVKEVC